MAKNIGVCLGYNCKEKGSEALKERLEKVCAGLEYEVIGKNCTGHCSKGPSVCIGDDIYSGSDGIFVQSDEKIKTFLKNYESITKIEGYCNKADGKECGLAIDIGTTAIKASLNDLVTGDVIGDIFTINKQGAYGSTVLHRWNYFNKAKDKDAMLGNLSSAVQKCVSDITDYFTEKSQGKISKVVVSANTAMTYFYLNKDPALTLDEKPDYKAMLSQDGKDFIPGIFEWVGGDIVSGMTALDFDKYDKNAMLIDLGTNGEIGLSTKDGIIIVAAASAGPAFEGEGFRCGMPAMNGAIHEVTPVNGELEYKVMGQDEPLGLCGSGMLDLIAGMMVTKVMDLNGRLDSKYNGEFSLTDKISVKQEEIDYFKESKAAIFATAQTLVQEIGMSIADLDVIHVAGGFGNVNIENAQLIGLLPPFENYKFMGNTSLQGAQKCLSAENLKRAEEIAKNSTPLYLTESETWMNNYMASLFFPHTDQKLFDKVLKKVKLI